MKQCGRQRGENKTQHERLRLRLRLRVTQGLTGVRDSWYERGVKPFLTEEFAFWET